ncbi:MAG: HAD-IIA family hydrolase [Bdellovibrionales bacterium]|nr:HAD-IIA family hydrolase [Bdellovibrionales bacterium]
MDNRRSITDAGRYEGYIFDLDGVVWLGTDPVPGVADAINALRRAGRRVRFLTNNASQHRQTQREKLLSMGVEAELSEVLTSASTAAMALSRKFGSCKVHVMGTEDLKREIRDAGHTLVERNADWVVVGYDREFSYQKLCQAFQNIYFDQAKFLACNENPLLPTEEGFMPGIGPSVAALACCTGKSPDWVTGKPHETIFSLTLESIGLPAASCAMVADVLDLDIHGAQQVGIDGIFVLTGVHNEQDIERMRIVPKHILPSAANLCAC